MPTITYKLEIDTGGRGNYDQPIDDITAYCVIGISTQEGMAGSDDKVSNPARMTFTVSNRGGEFSREGYLSGELVTNGGFDSWTGNVPDGWATTETPAFSFVRQVGAGGTLFKSDPNSSTGAVCIYWSTAGSAPTLIQSNVFAPGNTYRISVPITATNKIDTQHLIPVGLYVLTNGDVSLSPIITTANDHVIYKYIQPGQTQLKLMPAGVAGSGYGAECTLDNISVKKVPLYAMVRPGLQCRLSATYNGSTVILWQGRIKEMQPTFGSNAEPLMQFTAEDAMIELLDKEYSPPLLTAPTTDQPIQRMFDDAVLAWPYESNYWLLGVEGCSELGVSTYLFNNNLTSGSTLETGKTTFTYVGDLADRGNGIDAQTYIRDLMEAEADGRFWFDVRTGTFQFVNRHHDILNTTVAATLTQGDIDSVAPVYGGVINDASLIYSERSIGAANSVIWTAANLPFVVKRHTVKKLTVRFVDTSDPQKKISAMDFTPIAKGTDIVANLAQDGTGTDVTDNVLIWADTTATSAQISISNSSDDDFYITTLQLRGTPLSSRPETVSYLDGESIRDHQRHPWPTTEARLVDDGDFALNILQYNVARYKTPIQRIASLTFNSLRSPAMTDATINRVINDRITVNLSQAPHTADYFIVGIRRNIQINDSLAADITWILKPALRQQFWVLGDSQLSILGSTTILGL